MGELANDKVLAWLLGSAAMLLVLVLALCGARAASRRRAGRERLRRASHSPRPVAEDAPGAAVSRARERAALISRDAEAAAWQVARLARERPGNPFPVNTREFVLWEATFHSVLSDFAELEGSPPEPPAR